MLLTILLQAASPAPATTIELSTPVPVTDTTVVTARESQFDRTATTAIMVGEVKAICRRRPVTGSLARTTKECHTKSEWARLDEDVRKEAGEYVDHGRGGTNGH